MTAESPVNENSLRRLQALGQSLWLDDIRRDLIEGGELRRLIAEDGLRGITSNPAIFEKSITGSHDYDEDIRAMAHQGKRATWRFTRRSASVTCSAPPTSSGFCTTRRMRHDR